MSEVELALASERELVIEEFCAAGFVLEDQCTLLGEIDIDGKLIEHEIVIPTGFPIELPKVSTPGGEGGMSWHREASGHLCLWSTDGVGDFPWRKASAIIERVVDWHRQSQAGWPNDPPDLDLERYWPRLSDLVFIPDLGPLINKECKLVQRRPENTHLWQLEHGPTSSNRRDSRRSALVLSVGELSRPLHNLFEIQELLDEREAQRLERRLTNGDLRVLVLAYTRGGCEGVLVLFVTSKDPLVLTAADAAHDGETTRRMRSGFDAAVLADKRVAVVGIGALGSHLAEDLARSGVGALTLVDGELLRPGNCIRHVLGHKSVGISKAVGMRTHLDQKDLLDSSKVTALDTRLATPADVADLFNQHDLVIDATGNGPTSALITMTSRELERDALSACIQRGGTVIRVDRFPLRPGEVHSPVVPAGGPPSVDREAGCGDPVSPTPPWVCAAAAAHAAGMAADILSDRRAYPPTLLQYVVGESGTSPAVTSE